MPSALPDANVDTPVAALPGRRRLLRAGLMGAPALLALKSSPVLATNCKLPSGFSASGNLSRSGSKNCAAPAPLPSAWSSKVVSGSYSGTSITPSTTFASAGFNINVSYFAATDTFSTVLAKGNSSTTALTASVFLASITAGGGNFPNSTEVKKMWNNGVLGGSYAAGTGVVWDKPKVRAYLLYLTGQAV